MDADTIEEKPVGRCCALMRGSDLEQVHGNAVIHDTDHVAHDHRSAGKKES
jgi:hypothetical protein